MFPPLLGKDYKGPQLLYPVFLVIGRSIADISFAHYKTLAPASEYTEAIHVYTTWIGNHCYASGSEYGDSLEPLEYRHPPSRE